MTVLRSIIVCLIFSISNSQADALIEAGSQADQLKTGLDLIQQKKYQQAELHFQDLNQKYPEQILYLNNLAVALMAQSKTEQALESLNNSVDADKNYSVMQKNISQIYAYMASKAYENALANTSDTKAQTNLPELSLMTEIITVNELLAVSNNQQIDVDAEIEVVSDDVITILEERIAVWANTWMQADFKSYLEIYSKKFQPAEQLSYQDWVAQRRYRLRHSKQVKVNYNQLKVYLDADKASAIVEFVQQYKAGKYQDKVKKQLYWVLEGDNWLISREQVIEKL